MSAGNCSLARTDCALPQQNLLYISFVELIAYYLIYDPLMKLRQISLNSTAQQEQLAEIATVPAGKAISGAKKLVLTNIICLTLEPISNIARLSRLTESGIRSIVQNIVIS